MNLLILPFLAIGVGGYLLVRLRFFFILHPIRTAREFLSDLHDREVRRSFFLALAGTLGVGNIFGVCAGIMIGGAGSIFWLFVSSLFAMIIKYAETLLVFDSRVTRGGMSSAIKHNMPYLGRILSPFYALLTLLLSLFMGSALQSAALLSTLDITLRVKPLVGSVILIILLMPCLFGDGRKIENITEIIIPMTTMIYIIGCFGVIFANFERLGEVVCEIVRSAFNFRSAIGGGLSFLVIKEGFARGILSNEAGCGTSAMAHIRSTGRSPHRAALFAMYEVFFDTGLLCMLTGLSVLVSVKNISAFTTPMELIGVAFYSVYGDISSILLPFIILAFAYSTIVCWFYYGRESAVLLHPCLSLIFPILFLSFILFSAGMNTESLLYPTDVILLFMSIITLSLIIKKSSRIALVSRDGREKENPE